MSYYFYLGETLLPVAPTAIDTTINGKSGNYALPSSSIAVRGDVSG